MNGWLRHQLNGPCCGTRAGTFLCQPRGQPAESERPCSSGSRSSQGAAEVPRRPGQGAFVRGGHPPSAAPSWPPAETPVNLPGAPDDKNTTGADAGRPRTDHPRPPADPPYPSLPRSAAAVRGGANPVASLAPRPRRRPTPTSKNGTPGGRGACWANCPRAAAAFSFSSAATFRARSRGSSHVALSGRPVDQVGQLNGLLNHLVGPRRGAGGGLCLCQRFPSGRQLRRDRGMPEPPERSLPE